MAESLSITPGRPSAAKFPETAAHLNLDRLLVALDGRTPSEMAIPFAALVSKWLGSEITLFHVLPPRHEFRGSRSGGAIYPDAQHDRGANLATSYLQEVARRTEPFGMRVRWGTATGAVPDMIAARAVTGNFGLIVLSAKPRGGISRRFRPPVLDQLWRKTAVPLLIVNEMKMRMNGSYIKPPQTIFVPCPTHRSVEAAFPYLNVMGPEVGAKIVFLLPAKKKPELSGEDASQGEDSIEDAAALLRRRELNVEIEPIAEELDLAAAARQVENPNSWIVMGSRMRHGIGRSLLGSMADRVVRASPGPVMVIPLGQVAKRRNKKLHTESLIPVRPD